MGELVPKKTPASPVGGNISVSGNLTFVKSRYSVRHLEYWS